MRASRHSAGDVIAYAPALPAERGGRLADTRAGLSYPWDEPHRHASADDRACHESDHEAMILAAWFTHLHD
jgi:hypothetical protein